MIAIIDYGVGNLFSLSSSLSYLKLENRITNKKEEILAADRIILPGVGAFADAAEKLRQTGLTDTIKQQTAEGKPLLGICLGMQLLFEKSLEYGEHEGLGLIRGEICPIEPDLRRPLKVPHIGWNSLRFTENAYKTDGGNGNRYAGKNGTEDAITDRQEGGWSGERQNREQQACRTGEPPQAASSAQNGQMAQPVHTAQTASAAQRPQMVHPLLKYNKDGDYVYYVHSFYARKCKESTLAVSEYDVEIPGLVGSGSVFGAQFHPEKSGEAGLAMLRAFSEL